MGKLSIARRVNTRMAGDGLGKLSYGVKINDWDVLGQERCVDDQYFSTYQLRSGNLGNLAGRVHELKMWMGLRKLS